MAINTWQLKQKQERLKKEVAEHLDFLVGSVSSQGKSGRFNLTTKVNQKTTSRYIRAGMEEEVRRMTQQHKKLKALLKELEQVNWDLLKLELGN
jgi:hypothetical protein